MSSSHVDPDLRTAGRADGAELIAIMSAPSSVVIVGASSKPGSVAGRSLEYLNRFGFDGEVHVVHPRETEVLGRPAVPRIEDLPAGLEIAMLNTPAAAVPEALRALAERGVRLALSIAGGFEAADAPLRREVLDVMSGSNLRLIGPNCTGFMAPASSTFLTMSSFLQHHSAPEGGIAIVAQSGGAGNGMLMSLLRRGAGVSHLIATGNELDTGCLEIIAGLLPRDEVKAVGVFIEGITDVEWLDSVADLIAATGKSVFFLKAARTAAGRVAAGGHTGRVVGPADIASAVLADAGLREVRDLEQLGDVLVCSDLFGRPAGGRVGVVTVSGASAVLAADQIAVSSHLQLAVASPVACASAQPRIDGRLTFANPLDVGFNETPPIAHAMRTVRDTEGFDSVLGVVTSLAHDPDVLVAELGEDKDGFVPLVLTFLSPEDALPAANIEALATRGIAVVPTPERAIMALDLLTPAGGGDQDPTLGHEHHGDVVGIEAIADVPVVGDLCLAPWRIVEDLAAASAAAEGFGFPVVLKVAGRGLQHRSEAGGVAVGVDRDQLAGVFAAIHTVAQQHGDVVMAQQQVGSGFELMLSVIDSPEFGPVAIVRPGGVLAELMKEQVILAARWPPEHRLDVLRSSTLGRILDGYRGGRRYDVSAVADLAGVLTDVLVAGGFEFLELNPVIVGEQGAVVVDAIGSVRSGGTVKQPGRADA